MQRTQIKGNVIFGRVRKHRIRSKICGSNPLVLGRQSRVRWHRPWLRAVTSLWRRRLGDKCHETIVKHLGRVKLKAPLDFSWACYSDLLDFSAFFSTRPVVTGIQFSFVKRHRKAFPIFKNCLEVGVFCVPGKQVEDTDDQLGWLRVEAVETGTFDARHGGFSEHSGSKQKISQKPTGCVGFVVCSAVARFILAWRSPSRHSLESVPSQFLLALELLVCQCAYVGEAVIQSLLV